MQLPTSPTDVKINGSLALVATGSNIILVNLENPGQPILGGQITGNFGSWLSLSQNGELIATNTAGSSNSVQTSILGPSVITQCPSPLLAALTSGAPSQTPVYQTIRSVTCTIIASGASPLPTSASFTLKQPDGTIVKDPNTNNPIAPTIPLTNGVGALQLPAKLQVTGNAAVAQSMVTDPRFKSFPDSVGLSTIHIVLDSDNDTNVDPQKDSEAAANGKKFSFWQADPNDIGPFTTNGGQDGLLDFAPVRVYVGALPDPSTGKIQLVLQGGSYTANFVVTKNLAVPNGAADTVAAQNEKMYLTDSQTALNQTLNTNQTSVQCGGATGYSFEQRLCQSTAVSASNSTGVELSGMQNGQMYDLLFSITSITCPQSPCALDGSGTLQIVLAKNDGTTQVLDKVPVDIRLSYAKTHPATAKYRKNASCTETANFATLPISKSNLLVGSGRIRLRCETDRQFLPSSRLSFPICS